MKTRLLVWDFPTRFFHWSLVISVLWTLITGFFLPDRFFFLHAYGGYVIIGLIGFRLIWGFIGSRYSRFSSFPPSISAAKEHVGQLLTGKHVQHVGHNPLGGLMIYALLGVLLLLTASGLIAWAGEENQGPLAGQVSRFIGHVFEEFHEGLAFGLIGMIGLHLIGVIGESLLSRINLARSMVTGYKDIETEAMPPETPLYGTANFALSLALLVGFSGMLLGQSSSAAVIPPLSAYAKECGSCHDAYVPRLLPASSWQAIMSGLDDHFGEDASLSPSAIAAPSDWLISGSDRFGNAQSPLRITETPWWALIHRKVAPENFKLQKVGSKANCSACHPDALTGRFHDVRIPKEKKENI
jgi:cytochrome b